MTKNSVLKLELEELEQRIAPGIPPGLHGYEGQPGNQGGQGGHGGHGNPSGSANPEVPAGKRPNPNPRG